MVFCAKFSILSSIISMSDPHDKKKKEREEEGNRMGHRILLGRQGGKATSSGNRGSLVCFSTEKGLKIMMGNSTHRVFRKKYS